MNAFGCLRSTIPWKPIYCGMMIFRRMWRDLGIVGENVVVVSDQVVGIVSKNPVRFSIVQPCAEEGNRLQGVRQRRRRCRTPSKGKEMCHFGIRSDGYFLRESMNEYTELLSHEAHDKKHREVFGINRSASYSRTPQNPHSILSPTISISSTWG